MNSPANTKSSFKRLLKKVATDFPNITFEEDESFRWSSKNKVVYYNPSVENPNWSLLHELGHMLNGHSLYSSDRMLVRMEMEAWQTANDLSVKYNCPIDKDYVEDCIDSYRNWQHKRSTCPVCKQNGIETSNGLYKCINCREEWKVSSNRFCRVYRRTKDS